MAQGLGALVGGFQKGYKFSRDNARDKMVNKALDFEVQKMGRDSSNTADFAKMMGQDDPNYSFMPETWGSRLKGWIGSKFGGGGGAQPGAINPLEMQAPAHNYDEMAAQDPGYSPPTMKHGGALRHYADGGKLAETEEEKKARYAAEVERDKEGNAVTSGGGFLEGAKDVGRSVADLPRRAFPNTARALDENAGMEMVRRRDVANAPNDEKRGAAMRDYAGEAVLGVGGALSGFADDVLGPVPGMIKGAFGFTGEVDDERSAAVSALPQDDKPEDIAANVAAQPTGGGGGAGQVTPGAQAPAVGADQTGVEDDPIMDFSQVTDVNPADMPNKGQKEWEEERKFYAYQAHLAGRDPLEAMKAVDAKQMRGFTMYGQQALQLLRANNPTGAANALYAAYQYFPNGVDVKFGVHKGKDGRPVLIGMGTDEETGDPIKEGKPMVITAESLAVQIENMSDPNAFRAWTKDWRETEQEIRKYMEVEKPEAQSNVTYRAKAGDALLMNAQSRLKEAMNASAGGGLKQSDYDRAFAAMGEDAENQALFETMPPEDADYLKMVMAVSYRNSPGVFPKTSQIIRQAYREGGIEAVSEMVDGGQ